MAANPAASLRVSLGDQVLTGTGSVSGHLTLAKGDNEVTVTVTAPNGQSKDYVFHVTGLSVMALSDVDYESNSSTGWGEIMRNRSVGGNTLRLKKGAEVVTYETGLGIHAPAHMIYNIAGKGYTRFTAVVGVDAESTTYGDMRFRFLVDGVEHLRTKDLAHSTDGVPVDIDLTGASKFEILVDKISNDWDDHADVADAYFHTA